MAFQCKGFGASVRGLVSRWALTSWLGLSLCVLALPGAVRAQAEPPRTSGDTFSRERFVRAAREVLGVPYVLGGRLREGGAGLDCQGVLFYAAERVGRCGWKSFSVLPTVAVPLAELGASVSGLSPVASTSLDVTRLVPGDVLWLVGFDANPAEPSIGELSGRPVWVWHTGLYSGNGRWIVGDHFAGEVVEVDLVAYLKEHADTYSGLVVTRMEQGPRPSRCRQHAPMRKPSSGSARPPGRPGE